MEHTSYDDFIHLEGGDRMDTIVILVMTLMLLSILYRLLRPSIKVYHKVQTGEKFASMIYTDETGGQLLVSEDLDLQGKPDYIFETWFRRKYIPFEIKSGKAKEDTPHEGDLMQLLAYFLLIEEVYGKRPPYGKLVYSNKTFKVRNTLRHRTRIKRTLEEMRQMLREGSEPRTTQNYLKCKNCICQYTVCECEKED